MTNLKLLRISRTNLVGTIPNDWGHLSQLEELSLFDVDGMYGTVPSSIGNLSKLTYLELYQIPLTGTLPESIGNLTSLSECCHLSGALFPENIMSNLTLSTASIVIGISLMTGSVPTTVGFLSNLGKRRPGRIYTYLMSFTLLNACFHSQSNAQSQQLTSIRAFRRSWDGVLNSKS